MFLCTKSISRWLLSGLLVAGVVVTGGSVAEAKPSKGKSLSKILKKSGLSATPDVNDAFSSKKKKSKVSISGTTAPTLAELVDGVDLDQVFWGGALADILSGDPSQQSCTDFFKNFAACGAVNDLVEAISTMGSGQVAKCYLAGMAKLESGVAYEGSVARADVFDPPASGENRIVQINVSGMEHQERIVAEVTSVTNLNGDVYRIALSFCSAESNEARGGNLIRVTKSGKYLVTDASNDGESSHSFSFQAHVKPNGSGRGIEIDPASGVNIELGSERSDGSFFRKILIKNGTVLVRSDENRSDTSHRNAVNKISFSGQAENVRLASAAFKFQDQGHEDRGEVLWNSSKGQFEVSRKSNLLGSINGEDLDDSFYEDEHEVELDHPEFPPCDVASEDVSATITMDFSDEAAQQLQQQCEPLRLDGGLCFDNEDVRDAMSMYESVCNVEGPQN